MKKETGKIKKITEANLAKICFFYETSLGIPREIFIQEIVNGLDSLIHQMAFVSFFYEKHKHWCKKNGVLVYYKDMNK